MTEVKSELHEKEEKILQQQNIDIWCNHSSPAIFSISHSAGPLTSGNFLQIKGPNDARLKRRHLSEPTNNHFTPLAILNEDHAAEH